MSNNNYTSMTNQELVDLVLTLNNGKHTNRLKFLIKRDNPNLFNEILNRTKFVPNDSSFMARLYCLKNDIDSIPMCPTCHKHQLKLNNFGFSKHCSTRCSTLDKNVQKKSQDTCLKKYNSIHAQNSKLVQDKIKRTKLERYGNENFNNKEKARKTNLKKYGVEEALASPSIRCKIQETMICKYGVKYYVLSSEFKQKAKENLLNSIGVEHALQNPSILKKMQQTTLYRFGVTCSLRNPNVIEKSTKTLLGHFGVTCTWESDLIMEKARNTLMQRFGVDNSFKSKQVKKLAKQTMRVKYGVEYPIQLIEFKNKMKTTCLEKYGVEHYSQSVEYHKNKKHKYHSNKYPGLTFDSNWEVRVYEFCRDNDIQVEYQPNISFEYEYDGRVWTYHPDFLINDKIYEVKGDQFFKINESGDEEMFCPYRNPKWTDEYYNWICGKYEAKHQCMLKNNVIMLRHRDIDNLVNVGF